MHGLSEDNVSKSLSRLQFMESMKVSTMRFLSDRHTFLEYGSVIIFLFSHFRLTCVLVSQGRRRLTFMRHCLLSCVKYYIVSMMTALNALTSLVPAEELVVDHLQFIRNLIASMVSDARYRKGGVGDGEFLLPGFHIPKGKCK